MLTPVTSPGRVGGTTASMQAYDAAPADSDGGGAGLVLLYSPTYAQMPACFPLAPLVAGVAVAGTAPAAAAVTQITLGREPPAELVIAQPAVSRQHARIRWDGQAFVISDLGGRNGTLVNGAFIRESALRHGDEIRVGDCFFKFVAREAAYYQCYRIDGAVLSRQAPAAPQGIVGGWQLGRIAADLERVARSGISIILRGESGTGKEVFARYVHAASGRIGAFCALNCAAIPPQLLESELFGYRRGAFSGADRDHVGLVRAAHRGTLFLDEVGDMPIEAQAKLLRVLQTKEVLPLGATAPEQVDVRVVCATHRDLSGMQAEGSFRVDLYARLNEYSATLPPLRERKEDVYALCVEFLRFHKRPDLTLSVPYLTGVLDYDFPYNVRELEALIKRGIALVQGPALEAAQLSEEIQARMASYGRRADPHGGVAERISQLPGYVPVERVSHLPASAPRVPVEEPSPQSITAAAVLPRAAHFVPAESELRALLAQHRGNVAAVGRHYGKERMQVHRWMKKYNINPDEYR
jgi:transcriptional regulator with PAS, ATPase and Fis domain